MEGVGVVGRGGQPAPMLAHTARRRASHPCAPWGAQGLNTRAESMPGRLKHISSDAFITISLNLLDNMQSRAVM